MTHEQPNRPDLDAAVDAVLRELTDVDARFAGSRARTRARLAEPALPPRVAPRRLAWAGAALLACAALVWWTLSGRPDERHREANRTAASAPRTTIAAPSVEPRSAARAAATVADLPQRRAQPARTRRPAVATIDAEPLVPLASLAPSPLEAPPPVEVDAITVAPLAPNPIVVDPIALAPVDAPESPR